MSRPDICPGCDREAGQDEGYGLDPDCPECFEDPTPQEQWEVTDPTGLPMDDWRDKHDRTL